MVAAGDRIFYFCLVLLDGTGERKCNLHWKVPFPGATNSRDLGWPEGLWPSGSFPLSKRSYYQEGNRSSGIPTIPAESMGTSHSATAISRDRRGSGRT